MNSKRLSRPGPSTWRALASASLLATLLLGCGPAQASASEAAEREVRDLITALTPPPATAIPVAKSEYFRNRKSTLERLRRAAPDRGEAALRILREERPDVAEIRAGLLDVAAHTAPEATADLLVELVTTFGEDLYVRRAATELLGECVPERAVEVLEPLLRQRPDGRTYPPEEHLLDAWVRATDALQGDPVPLLCIVALDLQRPQEVRHAATRALGRYRSLQGRQALEALMVESSGNGYIRRLAMQSLRETLEQADFCETVRRVQANEADPEFIVFLQSALDERCR